MCYDISFTIDIKQLSDYFPDLVFDDQIKINFDPVHIVGHSHGNHPIIFRDRDDQQVHCRLMEWGCIPFYVKDEDGFKNQRRTMLNARSERILDDPKSYWYKIRNRRCLIPLTGFYEHREVKGFKNKIPYFIELKDQPLFFLPGLYSVAELPNKETGEVEKRYTFTLLTTNANEIMKEIHNGGDNKGRMPLLLPFELSKKWIDEELPEESYRNILNYMMPAEKLTFHSVYSIRSAKMRPDEKAKNAFYQWEHLAEIVL
ncbi:MAG: SOS response-associated peptidase family protein [Ferruginibacter sp.]